MALKEFLLRWFRSTWEKQEEIFDQLKERVSRETAAPGGADASSATQGPKATSPLAPQFVANAPTDYCFFCGTDKTATDRTSGSVRPALSQGLEAEDSLCWSWLGVLETAISQSILFDMGSLDQTDECCVAALEQRAERVADSLERYKGFRDACDQLVKMRAAEWETQHARAVRRVREAAVEKASGERREAWGGHGERGDDGESKVE